MSDCTSDLLSRTWPKLYLNKINSVRTESNGLCRKMWLRMVSGPLWPVFPALSCPVLSCAVLDSLFSTKRSNFCKPLCVLVREISTILYNLNFWYRFICFAVRALTFGTGILHVIQINHQPDATNFQFIILTFVYSSICLERFPFHYQELNDCSSSLWFYLRIVVIVVLCSWSGRPATAIIELLMMGDKKPETCWSVNKCQDNKLINCRIRLVIYLNCTMIHGLTNRPDHDQQHCYHHAPTVNQRLLQQLLSSWWWGVRTPETCWAVFKRQVINLRNWCIWLVDYFKYSKKFHLLCQKIQNTV
jgi:hypothetical protein